MCYYLDWDPGISRKPARGKLAWLCAYKFVVLTPAECLNLLSSQLRFSGRVDGQDLTPCDSDAESFCPLGCSVRLEI